MANICTVIAVHVFVLSSSKDTAEQLREPVQVGSDWQGRGLAGKDLGITVSAGWICIQPCTSMANKQNLTLSYNRSSVTGGSSEVIVSLCSALVRLHIE